MTDEPQDAGADKFRDTWKPTPFLTKIYDAEAKTFTMEFRLPKQLLMQRESKFLGLADWKALVHDEVLRYADRDGLVLEGQILIEEREDTETVPPPAVDTQDFEQRKVIQDGDAPDLATKQAEVDKDAPESARLSQADLDYRARMRQNMRDTAEALFGGLSGQLDGRELPGGREFKLDRKAFNEGFFGTGEEDKPKPAKRDTMIVKCEAMVSMSLGLLEEQAAEIIAEQHADDLHIEIPDDLSGLDDLGDV